MKDYSNKKLDKEYDIVVCGGGISSLYFLYCLVKSNITRDLKILLIEASNRLGGRIKTFDETISFLDDKTKSEKSIDISYEEGAGRISSTHKLTMSLIKELGLKNNLHKLQEGHHYFYDNEFFEDENQLIEKFLGNSYKNKDNNMNSKNSKDSNNSNNSDIILKLWTELSSNFKQHKYDRKELEKMSFNDFLKSEYKNDIAELLIFHFGYSDIDISNAWDTLETIVLSYDMVDKGDFYVLGGGLQQVIYKIVYQINILLRKKTNIKIEYSLNTPLINVKNKMSISEEMKKSFKNRYQCLLMRNNSNQKINVMAKYLYVALTKSALNDIEYFKRNLKNTLKTVGTSELLRIYAVYPKNEDNKVWFYNLNDNNDSRLSGANLRLKSIITDTKIKYIIPINYETGLIMISYTDNDYAEYWKDIISTSSGDKNGEDQLIEKLNEECRKIFPDKTIPKPIFINYHDWLEGVHHIKIGETRRHIEEDIIKMEGKGIFIGGEIVSKKQAWIEGALETALRSVKVLRMMRYFHNDIQDIFTRFNSNYSSDNIIETYMKNDNDYDNDNDKDTETKNLFRNFFADFSDFNELTTKNDYEKNMSKNMSKTMSKTISKNKKNKRGGELSKNITLEELETKGKNKNWIGIRGMVYDVTKFINIHPGGANIFKGMGKDHTALWNKSHNNAIFKSHLETAEGRKKYGIKLVGKLIA